MAKLNFLWMMTALLFFTGEQTSADLTQEDEHFISVELSFFSPFRPNPPQLFYRNGENIEQVRFPRTIQGRFIQYEGPPVLQFFTRTPRANGTFAFESVAEVDLSESSGSALLLFSVRNNASGEQEIRINQMDMSTEHLPAGTLSIVNLTGITMKGMIGETSKMIPPGITDPIVFDERGVFPIGLAFEFDDQMYPSFFNTVTMDPETRQWLFIAPPTQAGSTRVRVRFIEDHSMLRREVNP
jgi:hypothetical protein